MTLNGARAAILNRLLNAAVVTSDRVDFGDGNDTAAFKKPSSGRWVRPQIRFNSGRVTTLGGEGVATRRVRGGTIIIQVFSDLSLGEFPADELAETILLLYESRADRPVFYRDCSVRDIGRDESWWQKNVVINFDFDAVCV